MSNWKRYVILLNQKKEELRQIMEMSTGDGNQHIQVQVLDAEIRLLKEFCHVLDRVELGD